MNLPSFVPLFLYVAVVVFLMVRRRREQRARAAERVHVAMLMRLTWLLVNDRPAKVVYWTRDEVDASPDEPHLVMEKSPNGYALRARTTPLDNPDAQCIEVG